MAARSKAWVCGCSLAGIAGSNPAGAWMFVVSVVCYQEEVSASGWSRVQWSPTECGVSECDRVASIMKKPRSTRQCCIHWFISWIGSKLNIQPLSFCETVIVLFSAYAVLINQTVYILHALTSGRWPTWRTILLFNIIRLFQSSTCFEQTRAHHQEVNCINTAAGIVTLCKWPSGMQVEQQFLLDLHTGRPLTESDYTRCCINL